MSLYSGCEGTMHHSSVFTFYEYEWDNENKDLSIVVGLVCFLAVCGCPRSGLHILSRPKLPKAASMMLRLTVLSPVAVQSDASSSACHHAPYPHKLCMQNDTLAAWPELMLFKQISLMEPPLQCNPLAATFQRWFLTRSSASSSSASERERPGDRERVVDEKRRRNRGGDAEI